MQPDTLRYKTYPGPLGTEYGMLSLAPLPALFQQGSALLPTSQSTAKTGGEARHLKVQKCPSLTPANIILSSKNKSTIFFNTVSFFNT